MESLEHLVRSRIRMFLRNTWLVIILGTAILAGGVWLAFYFTSQNAVMKVAAGPAGGVDARLVEFLAKKFAHDGETIKPALVATSGPAQSAQAIADRSADLAILPANVGASAEWPVVAIVRQNVMAFIVPAPATATPAPATPGEAKPSAKTEEAKETGTRAVQTWSLRAGKPWTMRATRAFCAQSCHHLANRVGAELDTIIAIARPMHPRAASSELKAWTVEGWRFGGADCV
jgi:hypothetical protein